MSKLPPIETFWCEYLGATVRVSYPMKPDTVRVTLIDTTPIARSLYRTTTLIEGWFHPATAEDDAINLHEKATMADSAKGLVAEVTNVAADGLKPYEDPDTSFVRYQFLVSANVRTS